MDFENMSDEKGDTKGMSNIGYKLSICCKNFIYEIQGKKPKVVQADQMDKEVQSAVDIRWTLIDIY